VCGNRSIHLCLLVQDDRCQINNKCGEGARRVLNPGAGFQAVCPHFQYQVKAFCTIFNTRIPWGWYLGH